MEISAALVKDLRERTGAGMMECKKALVETKGDIEAAIEHMRKTGLAKADKKAGRTAAEGVIGMAVSTDGKRAVMVEVNCETDFVAKGDDFRNFSGEVVSVALNGNVSDMAGLLTQKMASGLSVADAAKALIAKIGENIAVRRMAAVKADVIGLYSHGGRIGVMVAMKGGNPDLARDVAMHIAATRPVCVSDKQVSPDIIAKEREIFAAQAQESGKPKEIIDKMVDGRIAKYLKEITLLGQPFVKDPDQTVEKLLKAAGAEVLSFHRLEVGEGIEKKQEDFVSEVAAAARGN